MAKLIRAFMRNQIIIDVDHQGNLTMDQVLTQTDVASYPVVAGHTGFNAITKGSAAYGFGPMAARQANHEAEKDSVEITRILRHKGMLAVNIAQPGSDAIRGVSATFPFSDYDTKGGTVVRNADGTVGPSHGTVVLNECAGLSTSFAQAHPQRHRGRQARRHGVGWRRRDRVRLQRLQRFGQATA